MTKLQLRYYAQLIRGNICEMPVSFLNKIKTTDTLIYSAHKPPLPKNSPTVTILTNYPKDMPIYGVCMTIHPGWVRLLPLTTRGRISR